MLAIDPVGAISIIIFLAGIAIGAGYLIFKDIFKTSHYKQPHKRKAQ